MKRRKLPDNDDGKVIANMNVDGMPWFLGRGRIESKVKGEAYKMSKEESRAYLWGALSASFMVITIFSLVFAALILFMLFFAK